VAGYFKDAAKGGDVTAWTTPFIIAGVACLAAAVIALTLRPVKISEPALQAEAEGEADGALKN
jgi:hypothetical protein